jgi:hypothetical protein
LIRAGFDATCLQQALNARSVALTPNRSGPSLRGGLARRSAAPRRCGTC